MRLSVVIVCFGENVRPLLDALQEQRRPEDEVIVVDNLAADGGTPAVRTHPAVDRLIEPPANLHYASGMNEGAAQASGEAVVLLNPDALPAAGFLDAIRDPPPEWDAWTGVLTLPGGESINNGGGKVHFTGLAWSGRYGQPVSTLPSTPTETGFLSGACLAVRLPVWRELAGYPAHYGVYHEDTDLSLRLRLAGRPFGVLTAARIEHHYDFSKGPGKWRNLERNRWKTVLRTYPWPVLAAVLPAMLACELPLMLVGVRRGWARAKLQAWGDLLRWLPSIPRERRAVQATARVSPRHFASALTAELDSPFLGPAGRSVVVRAVLRTYWRGVLALLPGG